ncbi:MAG: hypothetical protein B6D72_18130 [gamma proteobacterium symbiont of Ctena orbiculata]|uniref:Uncharacterized protein n=1 Tax=Candidatus Thiodiazotropha taylori TaxID=2792791 RepID=A0A944MB71_9GAMM|nr:hypothetical protein [Candidatus Thiodiazotropha taylori]PUB83886.1 MAG: hypothetical protein DBP00_15530 [gamma proteobacterium symbiont of Ctena orbiculata]MBT2990756.1 hypothetical protein [Candidatus Thiodiazotropha taylori]MBT2997705.1 hypothetical protein [Candidatus Thiodiazotropha taylori]MBT3000526.1 hypothetical protein [Candidatus Thiodiazotropha taylori]
MNETFDIPRILELRKLTRSISEKIETDLSDYLATLAPLFSPAPILGEYVRGGSKAPVKGAEIAFRDLKSRYQTIAGQKPFLLERELSSPLDVFAATPTLTAVEYPYTAEQENKSASLTVTSPLKWYLSYPDQHPKKLLEMLGSNRNQLKDELSHALLQCLTLSLVLEKRPGIVNILQGLRFELQTSHHEGLGELPVIMISCPLMTLLPPDDIIIQNTEISGIPSFEEIININDIRELSDPMQQGILSITKEISPSIYREIAAD